MPRWFGAGRTASIAFVERFARNPPPTRLFHYTSTAALVSIVRNNEMWLSDATFLNDAEEVEHGRKLALSRLGATIGATTDPDVKRMLEATLAKFDTSAGPGVYVACFSLEGDDLAQWRGYGRGEAPIAIGLEPGPLMFGYVSEGLLQQVLYEPDDQRWIFDQVMAAYEAAYAEDLRDPMPSPGPRPLPVDQERALCADSLYHSIWRYIVNCKHPAFRSELEVRFTYLAHDFSDWGEWYPMQPEPQFREQSGRVIPYLSSKNLQFRNMPREDAPRLPIRSIRVGPTENQALIARGARRLLDQFGHESVEIAMSGSPARLR